ncbi:GspE/PulE family protein [Pseudomonas sp. PDM20]|uniref:GspE/PulE family protein n=1 Tax=Pseudomonas sp. PDM20 TaxID=2769254 RepID=UPI0017871E93|nr:ATPase, T2SS/T4P/T4SS family [Pseudomonas sp. PDM20]MBD9686845.1 Flp pilus assembly complex ATPase component TadA [Pseudomonas sp. PDM20]
MSNLAESLDHQPDHVADAQVLATAPKVQPLASTGLSIQCLSATGGMFELSLEDQKMMCLLSNGRLLISRSHSDEHSVYEYMDQLDRAGHSYKADYVGLQEITAAYQLARTSAVTAKAMKVEGETACQSRVVEFFREAVSRGASDIHFMPTGDGHYNINFRVHGTLELGAQALRADGEALISSMYNSMCEGQESHFRPDSKQEGRLNKKFVEDAGLFGARIATRPTLNGPWMACRVLYDNGGCIPLEKMGYTQEQQDALLNMSQMTEGLMLLSGITGSGKSTSLQTLITKIIEDSGNTINVSTIEDPIEYRIAGANQTLLQGEWADEISSNMRMDIDALMVGEIRDRESGRAGIQGVLTGHLLLSTLHTQEAIGIIQRMVDLGIDENLVTDPAIMRCLVNQALVRILCPNCKKKLLGNEDGLNPHTLRRIYEVLDVPLVYIAGEGCEKCHGRGVVSRNVAAEILLPDFNFMQIFREKGKAAARNYWVKEMGGFTKNMHLIQKIHAGEVDPFHGERDVCWLDTDKRTLEK